MLLRMNSQFLASVVTLAFACQPVECFDGNARYREGECVCRDGFVRAPDAGLCMEIDPEDASVPVDGGVAELADAGVPDSGLDTGTDATAPVPDWFLNAYLKPSNTRAEFRFGEDVAISGDGNTIAIGAIGENSGSTFDESDTSANSAGAVYVFERSGDRWLYQSYVKPSFPGGGDFFGVSISLSDDGSTMVVGALREAGSAAGVNAAHDDALRSAGAAYVFTRDRTIWREAAYLKASNPGRNDWFGWAVAISGNGSTVAVGAVREAGSGRGIDPTPDDDANGAGAVYVFTDTAGTWTQEAYLKASNGDAGDEFGAALSLNRNGNVLVVGAPNEASAAIGIDGNEIDNSAEDAGAAYVFERADGGWLQTAYVKASNTGANDEFGTALSLTSNGMAVVVCAPGESSSTDEIDGPALDDSAAGAGAAYLYRRDGASWRFEAFLKSLNNQQGDSFCDSVATSSSGDAILVGAGEEDGASLGVGGDPLDDRARDSGAGYLFVRSEDGWDRTYLKASNTSLNDHFAEHVAMSDDGTTLMIGARDEDSAATSVDGDADTAENSGAAYIFELRFP